MQRQWPWYLFQFGVAAAILVWTFDLTTNPMLGAGLSIGGAYLATIVLRWLIDLCARAGALVRKKNKPTEDTGRSWTTYGHLRNLRKPYPGLTVREEGRDLIDPRP